MSSARDIPQTQAVNNAALAGSPVSQHRFLIPSPIPTRRSRTYSASERAKCGPTVRGKVKEFCREKGHGFIQPEDPSSVPLFVHISDIEGEYVPKEDDDVTYKAITIPPRHEKLQAVHVQIMHLAPGVSHERWDSPLVTNSNCSPSHGSIKDLHPAQPSHPE
ncbi:calcium-regulated heat stable protein 1 [Octopus bimaculoides]|uniref:CSD domain-containing protein n=1 Tax=Octopus bimaculoides TaxID=37653 RepID=A0A0L8GJK8_OCTBM|nr:calcium-regulated heat stable protein 1 [Octopus bimaculoides]XP_014780439.1 calcium-regulated heat stable protein 1 [Octopus bimaculoides]XP_014780440.1 calcium-regulated heat stable protein 1 [Octopus bimaculoides]XP_052832184.1 calcium-regulated heat stable protein 1 [Octopus bimaculoides]|eukprot:XP_014780438.1 PREDICTED: calcium-regulated heat stable protein 1-like [Octopus bimaculoides]